MTINMHLDYVRETGMWHVWNCTNHSEFFVKFDDRDAAIEFMVKMIAEVKEG